ncbi:MAG: ribonuclease D [Verrucomicrobia bacterium]|nr:ribonuclease D [Verrucomicrobiota bacterium]MBT7068951.1 ribonuclease D [Verrucomicrobiota bacterium]MBT7701590.1 ribonuclease D [Verrucomicrobiota bacterium]
MAARLRDQPAIAVDTEFVWDRTYYARLGLVQLGVADGRSFLVDPCAVNDLSPIGEILADDRITKILHDAQQDLAILHRATGAFPRNIFDTRLAAGFAGLESTLSLSNLLIPLLDVHLPKAHTHADWIKRPLAQPLLEYAADDVRYMPRLADILRERACAAGTEAWLDEELATLDNPELYQERALETVYLRLRGAASLPARGLAVLRELAAWLEKEARKIDLPRRWLMEDKELISIARVCPQTRDDLQRCEKLKSRTAQRHGPALLAAVQSALALPDDALPSPLLPSTPPSSIKAKVAAALEHVRARAAHHKVDPQLICSKGDLIALLHPAAKNTPHPLQQGWRASLLDLSSIG